jgi:hypothetical protein
MPFTRSTYPVRAPQRETKIVHGRFVGSASADTVDSQVGDGVTVTANAAGGSYTLTFDGRGALSDVIVVATVEADTEDMHVRVASRDLSARTVTLVTMDGTSDVDLAADEAVHFAAFIKDV